MGRKMRHSRRPRAAPSPRPAATGPATEFMIETVGGEGDGVAPGPVYVPYTLPG